MIKQYTISNFKAFSTPATLPIKPITLIYGANSAGKSSIFQSLLMLKQTMEEAENEQQLLITKGNYVDVGGYRDFIHNHHEESRFKFKAIFKNDGWIMDTFDIMEYLVNTRDVSKHHEELEEFMRSKDYGISIEIGYDEQQRNYINEIELFIKNSEKAFLSYTRQGLNEDQIIILHKLGILKESIVNINDDVNFVKFFPKILPAEIENSSDLYSFSFNDYVFLKNFFPVGINTRDYQKNQYDFFEDFGEHDSGNVSFVTLAGGNRLRNFLKNLYYIGPLRQHPSRIYSVSAFNRKFVGPMGEFTFDMLVSDKDILADVNFWLDKLKVGYHLKPISLSDRKSDIFNLYALRLVHQFSEVTTSIMDVGFGISQILPIVVQSVVSNSTPLCIEQPELHLHPALQAELGDLFIDSAMQKKNTLLIETHSEHVLLRIMRRIRETTNGTLPEGVTPIRAEDVSVVYVESVETDGDRHSIIREMPLNDQGELVKAWPGGFFEEGLREVF